MVVEERRMPRRHGGLPTKRKTGRHRGSPSRRGDALVWKMGRCDSVQSEGGGLIDEEEPGEVDPRYEEYLYDEWIWGSVRENRYAFPDVSMWY